MQIPRILISAISGGGGKTLLSLGLCRALSNLGHKVKPYKKGPDYIDARWLQYAAKNACTNLDPYFLDAERLRSLFVHSFQDNDLAIIEGNRGLFDGQDIHGTCASSELARILNTPVIISLNVTKMTRTAAAVLAGIANFEKDLHIGGVVLSQIGSARHEDIIRKSIEHYTDIKVLGALPRLAKNPLPERHMGLYDVDTAVENTLESLAKFVSEHCNISNILELANSAKAVQAVAPFWQEEVNTRPKVRIGYVYDAALWFYYEENFEALRRAGAELVPLSLLSEDAWPHDLDGIYLGGGYPEEFLEQLCNSPHLKNIKKHSEDNMPIYAECGGFMVLAASIIRQGKHYAMSGVFDAVAEFHSRPQGLGYVRASIYNKNPFHPHDKEIIGHEFHYSCCLPKVEIDNDIVDASATTTLDNLLCFNLQKGTGMGNTKDGLCTGNTFASYTHIYAPACPWWAENFVQLALQWQKNKR